jgi:hypothetical protein
LNETDILEQEYRKGRLVDLALSDISKGNYKGALTYLDAAIALSPQETTLYELRLSVLDIVILTEGGDTGSDIDPEDPNFTEFYHPDDEEIITPDFARELLSESQREDPRINRNAFSLTLGGSYGLTQPVYLENNLVLSGDITTPIHPFYRLSVGTRYFFNESVRQFGIAARYKGVFNKEDQTDMLEHQFDFTFHYRGFFAETLESRMILGAKIGVGYLFLKEMENGEIRPLESHNSLIAGFYFEDALLRYLFKEQKLFKKIVMEFDFDFIFFSSFNEVSMVQFLMGMGYQFNEDWSLGIFNEIFNSPVNIQETNSWEAGMKLKYTY